MKREQLWLIVLLSCIACGRTETAPPDPIEPPPPWSGYPRLSLAGDTSCSLARDGHVSCWGWLADHESTKPSAGQRLVDFDIGGALGGCGILANQDLLCWPGWQYQTPTDAPKGKFREVSVFGNRACGIRIDGRVLCWGNPNHGFTDSPPGRFMDVAVGNGHACALHDNGTALCWGSNWIGEANAPLGTFSAISAGNGTSCAARTDGTIACWGGETRFGEANGRRAKAVSLAGEDACLLRHDGEVECFGSGEVSKATPPRGPFEQISAGGKHACGVRRDGSIACWGNNYHGQASPPP